jgi:hypothetical protein
MTTPPEDTPESNDPPSSDTHDSGPADAPVSGAHDPGAAHTDDGVVIAQPDPLWWQSHGKDTSSWADVQYDSSPGWSDDDSDSDDDDDDDDGDGVAGDHGSLSGWPSMADVLDLRDDTPPVATTASPWDGAPLWNPADIPGREDELDVQDAPPDPTLPGLDPVTDALAILAQLDTPPWRADQRDRAWLVTQLASACVWCGRPTHTALHARRPDADDGVQPDEEITATHPPCEVAHFAHGLRVARGLARIMQAQLVPADVWSLAATRVPSGPAALALAADLLASDGTSVLPTLAGHVVLGTVANCRRCALPTLASVTMAGLSVVGPQHWTCQEARTYQGLHVSTLEGELYPGSP